MASHPGIVDRGEAVACSSPSPYSGENEMTLGGLKTCCVCRRALPFSLFYREARRLDGLKPDCKQCDKEGRRRYVARHSEAVKSRLAGYYTENRDQISMQHREYRQSHVDEDNARARAWALANPKKRKAITRRHDQAKRDQLADSYVRYVIHRTTALPSHAIPQKLIEAKRAHLVLIRLLKEKQK